MVKIETWRPQTEIYNVREFVSKRGQVYEKGKIEIGGHEVNSISIVPGRKSKLIPVQELAVSEADLAEKCKKANELGLRIWRGNLTQLRYLR